MLLIILGNHVSLSRQTSGLGIIIIVLGRLLNNGLSLSDLSHLGLFCLFFPCLNLLEHLVYIAHFCRRKAFLCTLLVGLFNVLLNQVVNINFIKVRIDSHLLDNVNTLCATQ